MGADGISVPAMGPPWMPRIDWESLLSWSSEVCSTPKNGEEGGWQETTDRVFISLGTLKSQDLDKDVQFKEWGS